MGTPRLANGSWRPTRQELADAVDARLDDVLAPELDVVFCGINPGLYSGAVGHHFARPGNRFWPALFGSGFTDRLLSAFEDGQLLSYGVGITNLVSRVTATAAELTNEELKSGRQALEEKVARYRPAAIAVLGIGAFQTAFATKPVLGRQPSPLRGTPLWVLPNPSGLQARYQLPDLIAYFQALRAGLAPGTTAS